MSSVNASTVKRGLRAKGFQEVKRDHIFFYLMVDGKKSSIHTMVSHGDSKYGSKYLATMARQVGLDTQEFLNLVNCPLSQDDFIGLLRQRNKL